MSGAESGGAWIVGLGAVSSVGGDAGALEEALFTGAHGLAPVRRFDTAPFAPVRLGGCVDGDEDCVAWSVRAAREAWRDAALEGEVDPRRVAVVAGTTEGEDSDIPGVARAVAEAVGARGPRWTVSTACTSSANAIGLGRDLLARGDADVVVAGGAERLLKEMYAGFHRLGVLAAEPCAPFGETRGTTLAEGAGFVVLTRGQVASRAPWAYLLGYGLASDAWHATTPEPRGRGIARAMAGSLADAGVGPDAIDYVNAHGTGTAANDDAEWRGIEATLSLGARSIPVSATKSVLGHAQGAAGALELIATLLCLRRGTIPHTLRVGAGRPVGPPDPVAAARPRDAAARAWLSNSSAFGGANVSLCLATDPLAPPARARRTPRVVGLGLVRFSPGERDETQLPELDGFDRRGTDPSTRFCLAAARRALDDAGVRVRGALRDVTGVFGGASRVSPESLLEYRDSIERGGLGRCSAAAFARLVLHAPVGAVSRLLALRGPTTTLAAEGIAGLLAFAYAADTLAERTDASLMLALGFEERGEDEDLEEGAACLALSTTATHGPVVRATASAGPDAVDEAVERALARAGLERSAVAAWCVRPPAAAAPSLASARLVQDAVLAVREGAPVAVAASAGGGASCAVVLTADAATSRTEVPNG